MKLRLVASAKINLTLEILGKRPDGYHDILSVMQTIDLGDILTFSPGRDIELACNITELATSENMVVRAAKSLREYLGYEGGATIYLEKRTPLAAGLGGGSSDAATTLKALARLWGARDIPLQRLVEIGQRLGADVPFFLYGGTALAQGKGELITPLPTLRTTWFVLLHPSIEIANKTAKMYASLLPSEHTSGQATHRLVDALKHARPLDDSLLFNGFDVAADRMFAAIRSTRQSFQRIAGRPVHLTGAGPTLFCRVSDRSESEDLRDRLRSEGLGAYSCSSTTPM